MNKKELAYAIILAASLFSLSLLLFSQGITSLSVSLINGQPFAVAVPTMFTMNKVIIMIVLASIGTYSLTMLTTSIGMVQNITTPTIVEAAIENQLSLYHEEDRTSKVGGNDTVQEEIETPRELELDFEKAVSLPYKADRPPFYEAEQFSFNKSEHKRKIASDLLEGDEKKVYLIVYEKKRYFKANLYLSQVFQK
ncbi:MAG: hypothetical protein NHB15_07880 [Methanosarcina barkeri]|nr:hypothetical protein [Methanosarcina sp. ERenArc_MAG2]